MALRASKAALARAAEILGTDRHAARSYLRRVQARAGRPVPYEDVVAAMQAVEDPRDEAAVAARAAAEPAG